MNDPRICIVGAGRLSTLRIYPYIGAAGAQLVGVCDMDSEKAERNARRFGGRAYTDMVTMLDSEAPDGVMICIGPEQHAALAPLVMQRGLPVYTEKPPAPTAQQAHELARITQESNVLCMTGFKKRHNSAYSHAKEWISKFEQADLAALSIDYASGQYGNATANSSFLLDFAIHIIDLTQYLFGDVRTVCAFAKGQDAFAVSLRFVNGAVGTLNLNDARSFFIPTEEVEISITGGNFMTIHNSSCWKISENGATSEWREPSTFTSGGDSGNDTGHFAEIVDFITAIKEKRTVSRSSISESYKSMVLYEAIKQSAEEDRIVTVSY